MTPERMEECLAAIGWTVRGLANQLGVHETRSRRWMSGQYEIPHEVEQWLEKLAAAHERIPVPEIV